MPPGPSLYRTCDRTARRARKCCHNWRRLKLPAHQTGSDSRAVGPCRVSFHLQSTAAHPKHLQDATFVLQTMRHDAKWLSPIHRCGCQNKTPRMTVPASRPPLLRSQVHSPALGSASPQHDESLPYLASTALGRTSPSRSLWLSNTSVKKRCELSFSCAVCNEGVSQNY